MRLGLVVTQGRQSLSTLWLSAEALPLVMLLSRLIRRYPPKLSRRLIGAAPPDLQAHDRD